MKNRKKIDKANRELNDFNKHIKKVWNEDFTDEKELLCLQFYKAGINLNKSYTSELEEKVTESMGYVDDMIKDRDAFHDRNVELEKTMEIAVESLEEAGQKALILSPVNELDLKNRLHDIYCITDKAINQLNGESNE